MLVVPPYQGPCLGSIWLTDEFDAIKKHISKITKLLRASLVGRAGGFWRWKVGVMSLDDVKEDAKVVAEPRSPGRSLKKRGWTPVLGEEFALRATLNLKAFGLIEEFGIMAEEWAVPISNSCAS